MEVFILVQRQTPTQILIRFCANLSVSVPVSVSVSVASNVNATSDMKTHSLRCSCEETRHNFYQLTSQIKRHIAHEM